mgnify:CR=1 FL=1
MIQLSPQWMLLLGMVLSIFLSDHQQIQNIAKTWSSKLLQLSVILLGTALNFHHVLKQGAEGVLVTMISIGGVFLLGYLGIKILKLDKIQGILITMGTAICGGSAIGALAPALSASSMAITISIGIVFLLNSLSVFLFPPIGHWLQLTQEQFGLWSALAIHDTSAVVASSSIYGKEALQVATTIKLTRALWIIPITFLFSLKNSGGNKKISIPWFILGFLAVSLIFTFTDTLNSLKEPLLYLSKQGFALTLFLIGLSFNIRKLKEVGLRPFIFGTVLWIIVSIASLVFVRMT